MVPTLRSSLVALCAVWAAALPAQDPVATDPAWAARFAEGRQFALDHQWDEAIAALSACLAQHPRQWDALRWRGHAYTGKGSYREALADLDLALSLDAEDAWTVYAHSMALHHLGEHARAIEGYSRALALDPTFHKALQWRGYTKSLTGDPLGALPDLDRALALDAGNPWLLFIRAKVYVALGDLERAAQDLWRVVDADPTNAHAYGQLGYIEACSGDPARASAFFERAIALDPLGQREARLWLVQLLHRQDRGVDARVHLEALASSDHTPEDPTSGATTSGDRTPAEAWIGTVAAYLSGGSTSEALVAAARTAATETERQERLCEAWLHIGWLRARAADRDAAALALAHSIAADTREKWEWTMAHRLLRDLLRAQ